MAGHDEDAAKRKMGTPMERMLAMAEAMLDVVRTIHISDGSDLRIRVGEESFLF